MKINKLCLSLFLSRAAYGGVEPCNVSTSDCVRSFQLEQTETFNNVVTSHELQQVNLDITQAVFVIQGDSRSPKSYYKPIYNSTLLENRSTQTLIIAPYFKGNNYGGLDVCTDDSCDFVAPGELYWSTSDWKEGGKSLLAANPISSFQVLDQLVQHVSQSGFFPHLKTIFVVGHSAGGQFTQRYAIGSSLEEQLMPAGIKMNYVVTNPSSYMYLNPNRADWAGLYTQGGKYPSFGLGSFAISKPNFINPYLRNQKPFVELSQFNSIKVGLNSLSGSDCQCSGAPPCAYERFKYGFDIEPQEPDHYMCSENSYQMCDKDQTTDQLISRYLARSVTYVIGQLDNSVTPEDSSTNNDLDVSCAGNFQGPDRLARGLYFYESLSQYGAHNHKLLVAADTGHDVQEMFGSYKIRKVLFGGLLPIKEYVAPVYSIIQKSTSRYLELMTSSSSFYAAANTKKTSPAQQWILIRISGDDYRLVSRSRLKYLDALTGSSYGTAPDEFQTDDTQIWNIQKTTEKDVYMLQQKSTGRYLDAASSGSYTAVTKLKSTSNSQKWLIKLLP